VEDDVTIIHLNTCKTKTLHWKFANLLQENHMDKESSLLWLSAGCICPETEGFPVAIQELVIKTINWESLLRSGSGRQMQKTRKSGQTTVHLTAGCSSLSGIRISRETQRTGKNNWATDCHKVLLLDRSTLPYYRYKPELVLESTNMILYSDRTSITDKTGIFQQNVVLIDGRTKQHL
jgi:hypothetical protein